MLDVSIDDADLEESLERVFARLVAARIDHVCLRVPARVRADHHLAHALRARIEATPSLRRVVLLHPSAAIGFVASSLSLWLPEVTIEGRQASASDTEAAPPASAPETEIDTCAIPNVGGVEAISAAIDAANADGSQAIVLVFDTAHRIDRGFLDAIALAVLPGTTLRRIALVHPSPGIGFLASGLALRCPALRVLAAANVADAQRMLAEPG